MFAHTQIADSSAYMSEVVGEDLYLFMGRELEALEEISAGNIIGQSKLSELTVFRYLLAFKRARLAVAYVRFSKIK